MENTLVEIFWLSGSPRIFLSKTSMVNVNVPLFVGVPVMRPLDVMSLSPLGRYVRGV